MVIGAQGRAKRGHPVPRRLPAPQPWSSAACERSPHGSGPRPELQGGSAADPRPGRGAWDLRPPPKATKGQARARVAPSARARRVGTADPGPSSRDPSRTAPPAPRGRAPLPRCPHKGSARHPPGPARSGLRGPPLLRGCGGGAGVGAGCRRRRSAAPRPVRDRPVLPARPPAGRTAERGRGRRRRAAQRRGAEAQPRSGPRAAPPAARPPAVTPSTRRGPRASAGSARCPRLVASRRRPPGASRLGGSMSKGERNGGPVERS